MFLRPKIFFFLLADWTIVISYSVNILLWSRLLNAAYLYWHMFQYLWNFSWPTCNTSPTKCAIFTKNDLIYAVLSNIFFCDFSKSFHATGRFLYPRKTWNVLTQMWQNFMAGCLSWSRSNLVSRTSIFIQIPSLSQLRLNSDSPADATETTLPNLMMTFQWFLRNSLEFIMSICKATFIYFHCRPHAF